MDILAKLFSSGTLVKVMRLFLFNFDKAYDVDDIVGKVKSDKKSVLYETKLLTEIGFLKLKVFYKTVERKKGKSIVTEKKKTKGWCLDDTFLYLAPVRTLLVNTDLMNKGDLEKQLSKVGLVKLIAVAGVFMQELDRRIDLLIVGDRVSQATLSRTIRSIESIIGTEVKYTLLDSDDFKYRMSIRDRLLRDIFDYPHLLIKNRFKNFNQ